MPQLVSSFIQIDGIPGESLDSNHKDWIEVLEVGHEILQPVSSTKSSAGGASTGRTQHGDFVFKKQVDKASAKLNEAVSNGKHLSTATLQMSRAGGSSAVTFYEIKLEQVMISKVQLQHHSNGNSGGTSNSTAEPEFPTEIVHLNYGKITWTYTQQKRTDGSGGGNVTAKADLTAGTT
jgi:type VI secretion system secreted protein Hcp